MFKTAHKVSPQSFFLWAPVVFCSVNVVLCNIDAEWSADVKHCVTRMLGLPRLSKSPLRFDQERRYAPPQFVGLILSGQAQMSQLCRVVSGAEHGHR
jgi:hypothetical protein